MTRTDDAIALSEAIKKVEWSAAKNGLHPTAYCRPRVLRDKSGKASSTVDRASCECGFWDALDLVRASPFGQMIRGEGYPR